MFCCVTLAIAGFHGTATYPLRNMSRRFQIIEFISSAINAAVLGSK